jgi:translocation and assembly module TamB
MAAAPASRPDQGAAVVVRIFGGVALALLALALLAILALAALNTQAGRAFVARQLEGLAPESGLEIDVGRLEGSLYGRLLIHDLRVSDPRGVFRSWCWTGGRPRSSSAMCS